MKKMIISSIALAVLSAPAFAAPQGTLLLQGSINQVLNLSIAPVVGVHNSLDLVNGESATKVAVVTEETNSNTGYKVMIRSQNAGKLKNGALDSVDYTLSYDASAYAQPTANDVVVKNVSTGGVYDHDSDLKINLTGSNSEAALTQGTYADTVTFTIQVN